MTIYGATCGLSRQYAKVSRTGQWGYLQQPGHRGPQGSQYPLRRSPHRAPPAGTFRQQQGRTTSLQHAAVMHRRHPQTHRPASVLPTRGRQNPSSRGHSRPGVSPAMVSSTSTTGIREGTDLGPSTDIVGVNRKGPPGSTGRGQRSPPSARRPSVALRHNPTS